MRPQGKLLVAALAAALVLPALPGPTRAAVPAFVPYSGRLTDGTGWAQSQRLDLRFRLYACACAFGEACAAPCAEGDDGLVFHALHEQVLVQDGYFTVNLGMCDDEGRCDPNPATARFPAELPDQLWISVAVEPVGEELAPRQPVGSVAYALRARAADDVSWTDVSDVPAWLSLPPGTVLRTQSRSILSHTVAIVAPDWLTWGWVTDVMAMLPGPGLDFAEELPGTLRQYRLRVAYVMGIAGTTVGGPCYLALRLDSQDGESGVVLESRRLTSRSYLWVDVTEPLDWLDPPKHVVHVEARVDEFTHATLRTLEVLAEDVIP